MKQKIAAELKRLVIERAQGRCEYCRLPQGDAFIEFHIEHIRSIKHGGLSTAENLAYSCSKCNFYKGSDVGTYLGTQDTITRFFNPRKDKWPDHFEVFGGALLPKTNVAEATIEIFKLNDPDRILLRQELMLDGRYP